MARDEFSLNSIVDTIAAGLTIKKPNALQYKPHNKQLIFHSSRKKGKLYAGGNRSGKTTGGVLEDIWWLTRTHPYRETPEPPVFGRLVTVDFQNGVDKIVVPNLRQWLPKSCLIDGEWAKSWNARKRVLTLENDSELEIMSYEQELQKFAGVPRHFVHCDEEPPKAIFDECKARLIDYGGSWWITMTPINGMTWTYEEIFDKGIHGDPLIEVVTVEIFDNPYITEQEINDFLGGLSDDEARKIRGAGTYVALGGLMFSKFDEEVHVIESVDQIPPRTWTHWCSMDHGYANPAAWLWHAVGPDGEVVTYKEHYKSEMTVSQHAEQVKMINEQLKKEHGIEIKMMVADPSIKQRQATTGLSIQVEYALEGIYLALAATRSVDAGINKMNTYFEQRKYFITRSCPNYIKEIKKYKHKDFQSMKIADRSNKNEAPRKKDDHACDSARYFFSFMPELMITPTTPAKFHLSKSDVAAIMSAGTTFDPFSTINFDPGTTRLEPVFIADEYVGEY